MSGVNSASFHYSYAHVLASSRSPAIHSLYSDPESFRGWGREATEILGNTVFRQSARHQACGEYYACILVGH